MAENNDNIKMAYHSLLTLVSEFVEVSRDHFRFAKEIGEPTRLSSSIVENARTKDHHMEIHMRIIIDRVQEQFVCRYLFPDGGQVVANGGSEQEAFCNMLEKLLADQRRS